MFSESVLSVSLLYASHQSECRLPRPGHSLKGMPHRWGKSGPPSRTPPGHPGRNLGDFTEITSLGDLGCVRGHLRRLCPSQVYRTRTRVPPLGGPQDIHLPPAIQSNSVQLEGSVESFCSLGEMHFETRICKSPLSSELVLDLCR